MPKIVHKTDLKKGIWDFLNQLDQEVEDDYLVLEVREDEIIFQSLTTWLEERKEAS